MPLNTPRSIRPGLGRDTTLAFEILYRDLSMESLCHLRRLFGTSITRTLPGRIATSRIGYAARRCLVRNPTIPILAAHHIIQLGR